MIQQFILIVWLTGYSSPIIVPGTYPNLEKCEAVGAAWEKAENGSKDVKHHACLVAA